MTAVKKRPPPPVRSAIPAHPVVDSTHDQPEPTPISALGSDLEQGPDETPGGTVAERLARPRAGLTPAVEIARRIRSAARRVEQDAPGLEVITQPTPGRGMNRPPGYEPEPAVREAPGDPPSLPERRWEPTTKDRRSRQHPPVQLKN